MYHCYDVQNCVANNNVLKLAFDHDPVKPSPAIDPQYYENSDDIDSSEEVLEPENGIPHESETRVDAYERQ